MPAWHSQCFYNRKLYLFMAESSTNFCLCWMPSVRSHVSVRSCSRIVSKHCTRRTSLSGFIPHQVLRWLKRSSWPKWNQIRRSSCSLAGLSERKISYILVASSLTPSPPSHTHTVSPPHSKLKYLVDMEVPLKDLPQITQSCSSVK